MEKWGQSREQQRAAREMTREAQAREKMEREIREWNEGEQRGRDVAADFSMEAFASQQAAQAKAKVAQLEEDMGRMEARLMTLEQQLPPDMPAIEEQASGDDTKLDTTGSLQSSYDGPFAVVERVSNTLRVEQGYIWAGVNGFYNWPNHVQGTYHNEVQAGGATGWYGVAIILDHGTTLGPYHPNSDLFQTGGGGPAPFDEPYLRIVPATGFPTLIAAQTSGTARLLAVYHWDATLAMITHLQQRQFGDIYPYVWAIWAPYNESPTIIEPGDVSWLYYLRPVIHRPNNDYTKDFPDPMSPSHITGGSEDPDQREHS